MKKHLTGRHQMDRAFIEQHHDLGNELGWIMGGLRQYLVADQFHDLAIE